MDGSGCETWRMYVPCYEGARGAAFANEAGALAEMAGRAARELPPVERLTTAEVSALLDVVDALLAGDYPTAVARWVDAMGCDWRVEVVGVVTAAPAPLPVVIPPDWLAVVAPREARAWMRVAP